MHGGDYSAVDEDGDLDSMDGRRTQMSQKGGKKGAAISRNLIAQS